MKLRCTAAYTNRRETYQVGDEIEVSEREAASLLADSPGSFEVVADVAGKAVAVPPRDKMIRSPVVAKDAR